MYASLHFLYTDLSVTFLAKASMTESLVILLAALMQMATLRSSSWPSAADRNSISLGMAGAMAKPEVKLHVL